MAGNAEQQTVTLTRHKEIILWLVVTLFCASIPLLAKFLYGWLFLRPVSTTDLLLKKGELFIISASLLGPIIYTQFGLKRRLWAPFVVSLLTLISSVILYVGISFPDILPHGSAEESLKINEFGLLVVSAACFLLTVGMTYWTKYSEHTPGVAEFQEQVTISDAALGRQFDELGDK